MQEMDYYTWNTGLTVILVLTAIIGSFFAWYQLRRLADSLATQTVGMVLGMDKVVNEANQRLAEISIANAELAKSGSATKHELEIAQLRENHAIQNYLNSLDRVCSFFLNGSFSEKMYKSDYRTLVHDAVKNYSTHFGGPQNLYFNLQEIHKKWQKE